MVGLNYTLFDIRFGMNCNIHIFLSVYCGGLAPLSTLLIEHGCTPEKQPPAEASSSGVASLQCAGARKEAH